MYPNTPHTSLHYLKMILTKNDVTHLVFSITVAAIDAVLTWLHKAAAAVWGFFLLVTMSTWNSLHCHPVSLGVQLCVCVCVVIGTCVHTYIYVYY